MNLDRTSGICAARRRFALGILLGLLLLVSQTAFAQLPGWTSVTPIFVTEHSGATLNGYQLRLVIDTATLISHGTLRADGGDLRFGSDQQGTTLYNYYLESGINTATTVVWVKLGTLPASSSIRIYMYTGNPGASSASTVNVFNYTNAVTNSATSQVTGGSAGGGTVGNSQRGFRFTSSQDLLVTALGKYEPNGTTRYVTLFHVGTQAKLAQAQVSGAAGAYAYASLTQPIWLTAQTQYIVELHQAAGDGYYFGAAPQVNPLLTFYDMQYCNTCDQNAFPTNSSVGAHYGYPDFQFRTRQQVSPAPTYTLLPAATTSDLARTGADVTSYGQSVTFTTTVSGISPGGTVAFYDTDGSTPLNGCASPVPLSASSATCVTNALDVGTHTVYAHYSGDADNLASDATPLTQQVLVASTTTLIDTGCRRTFTGGQSFTFDAGITGLNPSGTASFFFNGSNPLCANVPIVNGTASCTTSALTVPPGTGDGTFDLIASYSGDASHYSSTSDTLPVTVLDPANVVFRGDFEAVRAGCPIE
jgi:hypothetical protein